MKTIFPLATMILVSGCAAKDVAIEITNAEFLDAHCAGSTTVSLEEGFLCWPASQQYIARFAVNSNLEQPSIKTGNDTLTNSTANDFITDQVNFSYSSLPSATFSSEADVGFHIVIPAGASGTANNFVENMFQTKAQSTIGALMTTNNSISVLATVQLQGHLLSGAQVLSNKATFAITVDNCTPITDCSPVTASDAGTAATPKPPTWPCGNVGQDAPICQ